MKRIATVLCVVATLFVPGIGRASGDSLSGHIAVGDPVSGLFAGISDTTAMCDPSAPANGVDGVVFEISDHVGQSATLTADPGPTGLNDVDAYLYDANCQSVPNGDAMAIQGPGVPETTIIPTGVKYIVVDLYTGANADFTLSFAAPPRM